MTESWEIFDFIQMLKSTMNLLKKQKKMAQEVCSNLRSDLLWTVEGTWLNGGEPGLRDQ